MRQTERYQVVRDLWLNLVRATCLTQSGGYPGGITVSRRFSPEVTALEVGQFGRTAQRVVQEYGLFSELTQEGNCLSIRVAREPASTSQTVTDTTAVNVASVEEPGPSGQPAASSSSKLLHVRRAVGSKVHR